VFFTFAHEALDMADHQGKGPASNEGRVEKNTSRATENSSGKSGSSQKVSDIQQQTRDQARKTLGK